MLRFLDAGESHGKALTAIIEGIPSNAKISLDYINNELKRRQQGYGRGGRMKIEQDKVEVWSGLRDNFTTGNPITLIVHNNDYKTEKAEKITIPRPGHGDMVGYFKYKTGNIRDTIERTSARETAIRTSVGALAKCILKDLQIEIRSKVQSIGGIEDNRIDIFDDDIYEKIEKSPVRCYNNKIEEKIIDLIDSCAHEGETVGGSVCICIRGVPLGIGSYSQWDRKLDGILSGAVMSVQGIKAVEIGDILNSKPFGSTFNDEIIIKDDRISRMTNNAGGIEAGVSNGQDIELTAFMKPIPTIKKPINTIDLETMANVTNRYERSDTCGVVPVSIILENVCAFEILKEILNKFPCDEFNELKKSIDTYRGELKIE